MTSTRRLFIESVNTPQEKTLEISLETPRPVFTLEFYLLILMTKKPSWKQNQGVGGTYGFPPGIPARLGGIVGTRICGGGSNPTWKQNKASQSQFIQGRHFVNVSKDFTGNADSPK